jgi:hypothetical protein
MVQPDSLNVGTKEKRQGFRWFLMDRTGLGEVNRYPLVFSRSDHHHTDGLYLDRHGTIWEYGE